MSERRIIAAMFRLGRWATANEIAKWADNMSWNTSKRVLRKLATKKIVRMKRIKGVAYWELKDF